LNFWYKDPAKPYIGKGTFAAFDGHFTPIGGNMLLYKTIGILLLIKKAGMEVQMYVKM